MCEGMGVQFLCADMASLGNFMRVFRWAMAVIALAPLIFLNLIAKLKGNVLAGSFCKEHPAPKEEAAAR